MRGESALHNQDWTTAESLFRHVLKHDPSNPACHMGLAKALNRLGRIEEQRAVQERSLTLARIRVNLAAVNNSSATAARELASDARSLQMNEAAAAFELLADRMSGRSR